MIPREKLLVLLVVPLNFLLIKSDSPIDPDLQPLECKKDEYKCENSFCYTEDMRCNFNNDCGDWSDESLCPSYCEFDNATSPLCGWENGEELEQFSWVVVSTSSAYAPQVDWEGKKVTAGAKFLVLQKSESDPSVTTISTPVTKGKIGPISLRSPYFTTRNSKCKFSFRYALNGSDSQLILDDDDEGEVNNTTPVLFSANSTEGEWRQDSITMTAINERFRLILQGFWSEEGFVAADSFKFENCEDLRIDDPDTKAEYKCSGDDKFLCKNSKCISADFKCNFVDECGDNSDEESCPAKCDFRHNFCGWTSVDPEFEWKLPKRNFGPDADSKGLKINDGGRYLIVDRSEVPGKDENKTGVAVLESPSYLTLNSKCKFSFQHNTEKNVLKVFHIMKNETTGEDERIEWFSEDEDDEDDESGGWDKVTFPITEVGKRFSFLMTGSYGRHGHVAVDSLNFWNCGNVDEVEPTPPTEPPGSTSDPRTCSKEDEFECLVRNAPACLPMSSVCNFQPECEEAKDENGCTDVSCDFHRGLCDWQLQPSPADYWMHTYRDSTDSPNKQFYPPNGHSHHEVDGFLIFDPVKSTEKEFILSDVNSTIVRRIGPSCFITFYYWCHLATCPIEVFKSDFSKYEGRSRERTQLLWEPIDTALLESNRDESYKWRLGKVFVGRSREMKITFRSYAHIKMHRNFTVGLDDVVFDDSCLSPPTTDKDKECSEDQFRCLSDESCISKNLLCDFVADCEDASDEAYDENGSRAKCEENRGMCDFEDGCNFWKKTPEDHQLLHQTAKTGHLTSDHTLRKPEGTYLTLDTTKVLKDIKKELIISQLTSPFFDAKTSGCRLRFWHNIIDTSGVFSIRVIREEKWNVTQDSWPEEVFEYRTDELLVLKNRKDDEIIDFWSKADVSTFTKYSNESANYRLILELSINTSFKGSVNIDDISLNKECILAEGELEPKSCPPDHLMCKNGRCYATRKRCNFIDDCGDGSDESECPKKCDFSSGLCGWRNELNQTGTWRLNIPLDNMTDASGKTLEEGGRFLITSKGDVNSEETETSSKFLSPKFGSSGSKCSFKFTYIKTENSDLKVVVNKWNGGKIEDSSEIFRREATEGNKWHTVPVSIPFSGYELDIEIHGNISDANRTFVAIDDFEFHDCVDCDSDEEFQCKLYSRCIPQENVCDGIFDCQDGSDEDKSCGDPPYGSCDFEYAEGTEKCSFKHHWNRDFKWEVSSALQKSEYTGPQFPLGNNIKYFMLANSKGAERRPGQRAAIRSPVMGATEGECQLTFYYNMYSSRSEEPFYERPATLRVSRGKSFGVLITQSSDRYSRKEWMADTCSYSSKRLATLAQDGIQKRSPFTN